jgi:hypothetical protein
MQRMERFPASWVIRCRENGAPVMETFDRGAVERLRSGYEAVPILTYLEGLNARPDQMTEVRDERA